MVELHNGVAAVRFDAISHTPEPLKVTVIVCTELAGEAHTAVLHRSSTGHGEPKSTLCTPRQPMIFVVAHNAIGAALQVGQRRQHKAIVDGGAVVQAQWR